MPTYCEHDKGFASKGVAGTGLGLGIAGTALGLLAGGLNGGLGGFGGGYGRGWEGERWGYGCEPDWRFNEHHFESKEAARLREELAASRAEQCAERGDFALYREMDCKFDKLLAKQAKLEAELHCQCQKEERDFRDACEDAKTGDKFVALEAKFEDERIWCKMPKTRKFIPENEIVHREDIGCGCHEDHED